ncbi:serine/threonine protein kinase [Myxococcus sp. AM001]|uniref:serine/threonine protein kinase n=1 Tax=Myxococcus vastator TaxID=2709664 RepID=UPI0013D69576|nr:serine/threonine protein kinase [Myxococcus vastator]NVJ04308.1 serine/threonine protein kinase [Myxococcus sp. AM001]
MELDELKQAWQTLGRQLERNEAIGRQLLRDQKLAGARKSLLPLAVGQSLQILFGIACILLGVACWSQHAGVPHVLAAGITLHAYGIAIILLGGITLGRLRRIDYSSPVLTIQKDVLALRRLYIRGGMAAGLPWWMLWVPAAMVLAALVGVDLYARAPVMVWSGLASGILGLLATWGFHRWTRHPKRAALGKKLDDSAAGHSIRRSQRILDEVAAFERE